jgi:O-antigen ligase
MVKHFQKISTSCVLDEVIELLWLTVVFALPLVFLPSLYTTFEIPKVVLFRVVTWIMLLLFLIRIGRHGMKFGRSKMIKWLWIFGGAFLTFYLLATIFSTSPIVSIFGFYPRFQGLYTFSCYVIFALIVFLQIGSQADKTSRETQVRRIIKTIFISVSLVSVIALLQKFLPGFLAFWNDQAFEGRIYGTMANPNYLGSILVMIIPLMLIRLVENEEESKKNRATSKNIFTKTMLVLALLLNFTALYFTYSRAAFVGLAIGLFFAFWVMAKKKHSPGVFWVTVGGILVIVGFVVVVNLFGQNWKSTFLERLKFQGQYTVSAETRLELWPAVTRQILARPLLGYGPETFALTFPNFAPKNINTSPLKGAYPDRAHNEILDMAVQIGIPGLMAYLGFLILFFVIATKKIINDKSQSSWYYLGLLSGILALFVSNQFGFSVTTLWVYFFLFVAVLLQYLPPDDNSKKLAQRLFAKSKPTIPDTSHSAVGLVEMGTSRMRINIFFKIIFVLLVLGAGSWFVFFHDVRLIEADLLYRKGVDISNNNPDNHNSEVYSQYLQKAALLQPDQYQR